jgi:hypothetical protein
MSIQRCTLRAALWLLLTSCHGEQKLHSDCLDNPGVCPTCTADSDCVIESQGCFPDAYCTHQQRNPRLNFPAIGCGSWSEYDVPPASRCGCIEAVCRVR